MHSTPQILNMDIKEEIENFKLWLVRLGYAENTQIGNSRRVNYFLDYIKTNKISNLNKVTSTTIKNYQNHLDQLPIKSSTISAYLSSLRLFDKYLQNYGRTPLITTKLKTIPHTTQTRIILTQQEITQLYKATDQSVIGFRDRAILSIYYGCGLRATEGRNLIIQDIDFKSNLLQVRKSKTHQPRYVPMNKNVQEYLKEWLEYGRIIALTTQSNYVLVHSKGQYKDATGFNNRLKKLQEQSNITKQISLHGLRHSIATHLLENGMKLEQIMQFLGHHSLEVTQRYTHLVYG